MGKLFGVLILSLLFTGVLLIPFINFLYRLRFRQKRIRVTGREASTKLYWKLHGWKVGTPIGGGILIIVSTFLFSLIFYALSQFTINWTAIILFFTFFSFGLLGFYDDYNKFFRIKRTHFLGLRIRHKFMLQWIPALTIAFFLFTKMNLSTLTIPYFWGKLTIDLGVFYVPFAATIIVFFSNAFNITDGLDGLSTGLLLISLTAFWHLSTFCVHQGDINLFIATLMGSLLAFLYFNIYPARLWMGDTGALAFGAMLAVVALMIEQVVVLPIVGGVFVAEAVSSLIQLISMHFRKGKKVFLIAPLHHHFEALGWDETKVTMRFWLAAAVLAFVGMLVATLQF